MASSPISPAESYKKHPLPIQQNPHPYAIRSTSSGLLSRSNSSPHYANHTRHHYVPSSPSRVTTGTGMRHRHSSSLSSMGGELEGHDTVRLVPAPLPTPPPFAASQIETSESSDCADDLTHRVRRAGTMPSSATEVYDQKHNYDQDTRLEQDAAFTSSNPKKWNTDELTAYLKTSLWSGDDTILDTESKDDTLVDILDFVRTRGLTGRELLRLADSDLTGTPLSVKQRAQLLERSRTLRAHVLRGRINVDSYHLHEISDDIYTLSAHASTPSGSVRGASVSADDLRLVPNNHSSIFPQSPAVTLHNSVFDASAQRYRELARMRMRRRGRVKGLVETWERASTSGSECSAEEEGSMSGSEAESESEFGPQSEPILGTGDSPESPSAPSQDDHSAALDSPGVTQDPSSMTPPPPYTHVCTTCGAVGDEEEEPSIEELLASSSDIPLKGARAWEADFGLGETVKRVPVSTGADAEDPSTNPKTSGGPDNHHSRSNSTRSKASGMRGGTRNVGKSAKTQNRVVTAIFTGFPTDDISNNVDDDVPLVDYHRANGIVRDDVSTTLNRKKDSDSILRALEESIAATRAQMEGLRVRLELVEVDTTRLEAELDRARYADVPQPSALELRQRRSEASVQATMEIVELPSSETLVAGPQGWETVSLSDVTRAIAAKAVGWIFPYGRLGEPTRDPGQVRTHSRTEVNGKYSSPAKRSRGLPLASMSCSIIWVSFAICAAVLRRMGFGRWVRRP